MEDIVRALVNQLSPDRVMSLSIRDYVNLAVNDIAGELNGVNAPDYGSIYTGSVVGNQLDLQALNVDRVIKVVDSLNGLVPPKSDYEFENLKAITSYASSVFHQYFGERLFFFKGANIHAFGTIYVHYYRQPTPVSGSMDFLDIPDKHVPLVLAKVKSFVYEQCEKQAPDALTALIASRTAAIRSINAEDTSVIKGRQRTVVGEQA
jgi:hypothetical protein